MEVLDNDIVGLQILNQVSIVDFYNSGNFVKVVTDFDSLKFTESWRARKKKYYVKTLLFMYLSWLKKDIYAAILN
jgi:hypothetical protein